MESELWRSRTKKVTVAVISVGVVIGLWKLSQAMKTYMAKKIAEAPMLEATVNDIDFQHVSREGVEYSAKVSISNPYPTPLAICEISYSLKSDGREIASRVIPNPGFVEGEGIDGGGSTGEGGTQYITELGERRGKGLGHRLQIGFGVHH